MTAGFQLRDVRIAIRSVDELVMGQMLQAVMVNAAEQWKHREQVGSEVIQFSMAKKSVMNAVVGKSAQLVLTRADENDGGQRNRHVPPERNVRR